MSVPMSWHIGIDVDAHRQTSAPMSWLGCPRGSICTSTDVGTDVLTEPGTGTGGGGVNINDYRPSLSYQRRRDPGRAQGGEGGGHIGRHRHRCSEAVQCMCGSSSTHRSTSVPMLRRVIILYAHGITSADIGRQRHLNVSTSADVDRHRSMLGNVVGDVVLGGGRGHVVGDVSAHWPTSMPM